MLIRRNEEMGDSDEYTDEEDYDEDYDAEEIAVRIILDAEANIRVSPLKINSSSTVLPAQDNAEIWRTSSPQNSLPMKTKSASTMNETHHNNQLCLLK